MSLSLFLRLVRQGSLYIYILCAMGMLLYLRAALVARREGSQAIFSLEKETYAKKVTRSSTMILLLLCIVVGVYALSHYADIPEPNSSPIVIATPTPEEPTPTRPSAVATPTSQAAEQEPTATRQPRVTTVVLPTIARETPTVHVAPAQCPHANVQVFQPGANQTVRDGIAIRGIAEKEDFDRYEFKFRSRDFQDEWHWVETFKTPVQNGDLGWWPTAHLPAGKYDFMLIAIDKTGNSQECVVPVIIEH